MGRARQESCTAKYLSTLLACKLLEINQGPRAIVVAFKNNRGLFSIDFLYLLPILSIIGLQVRVSGTAIGL